ncbi:MAG: TolC family outer membrane protein [Pseudomonadota bacterium]|nr:TolC family outer membrane protein [Pseudomonadota bacterium]MEC8482970.1 TolC family outer membrane protein [Pseudomonadota bacterium]
MFIRPQLLALVMSASIAPALMAQTTITDDGLALESVQTRTMGFADALSLAKQNDPELKYAFHSYKAEQEADDISRANLLPNISLSSSYRYSDVDDYYTRNGATTVDTVERSEEEQDDYSFQLNLQQSLINVSAWKAYSSAKEAVRQSQFSYNRAEQELIYRLSEAYLKTLLAAQRVYITQEKLESLQLKLDQTTRMNELGVGDRLNVLRARSSRDVAKSDLLQAKGLLDDAQTALENITGQMINMPDAWIKNGHLVLPNLLVGEQQAWLDQVPDNAQVLAELSNVRAKELESEASRAQHLPTLNFQLTYLDRTSDDPFVDSTRGIASLNLEIPIYSGGKTSAQARQAEAGRNAAQVRYEKALSDTRQAVKLAYTQLNSYHNRLLALDESRRSGQAYLEAAERQADLSLGSQVDVLEARTELYDIRLEFAKTLSDYLLADLNLLLETGQLNDAALVRYDQLFDQDS